jgi:glycine cleavage system aminomethyltransferase T
VALIDRSDRGRIVFSGVDRASYLQGMLSNDIAALTPGQGCYACYLTAQGRMISDMWLFELGDVLLMTTPGGTRATVLDKLDQFIFSEDVQLGDVTETCSSVALLGPEAAHVLHTVVPDLSVERLTSFPDGGNVRVSVEGQPAIVLRVGDAGVPAFELLVNRERYESTWRALEARGGVPTSIAASEAIRIEGGVPRFHQDMDDTTIPL